MRILRRSLALSILLASLCFQAVSQRQNISLTGTLQRMAGIGGESTGWGIQLDSPADFGGRQVRQVEIAYANTPDLNRLADKRVEVTGKVGRRKGVETGERAVLEVSTIREASANAGIEGSEWLLEDLAGNGVVDRIQATLDLPAAGRVSGNGSCNRFMGSVEIQGSSIKFGPLATTRRACAPAVMDQESKYLKALEAAERLELKEPYLLLHCKGYDKPLRFTRRTKPAAANADLTQLFSRIWRVVKAPSTPAPGAIFVFLPNGTLLQTSCGETYRIATWTVDKNAPAVLRVTEDGRPAYTASIEELSNSTLRIKQQLSRVKETSVLTFEGIEKEAVCPDLRK